jgi:hypothetical protein
MDCMLLNGNVTWNLSAKERKTRKRQELSRHEYMLSVAESLLEYTEVAPEQVVVMQTAALPSLCGHVPFGMTGAQARCQVCRLECRKGMNPKLGEAGVRVSMLAFAASAALMHTHSYL